MTRRRNARSRAGRSGRGGFTLIEMMVTIAIIGLAMSVVFGFGENLLPQSRLSGSASAIASLLEEVRMHAIITQQDVVVAYDFTENGVHAFYPQERDSEDVIVGPGRTTIAELERLRTGILLERIVLANGTIREDGEVTFPITPEGRIAPHDVIIYNPDYPDIEVRTIRVHGHRNEARVLEGRPPPEMLDDISFR